MKKISIPLIVIFCSFLLATHYVQAEQLLFSKQEKNDLYLFNYQWLDSTKQKQSMSFSLSKSALFDRFRNFRRYKSSHAEKSIYRSIKKKIRQKPLSGVQIKFLPSQDHIKITITGDDPLKIKQAQQQLAVLEQQATKNYLENNYYQQFITVDQINGIKPDHTRIAAASVADLKSLKPIILDEVSIQNIRKVTNYVLNFVQNIPYSPLESRLTSSGAGFNPPLKLLWENQGDCDSKVTLTGALLRSLMPRIGIIFVFIDQHAFIGLAIPANEDEITITQDNITYVLAEPTGPALLNLGQLAPESEQAIYRGHYIVETFN